MKVFIAILLLCVLCSAFSLVQSAETERTLSKYQAQSDLGSKGVEAKDQELLTVIKRYLYEEAVKSALKSPGLAIESIFKYLKKKYGFTEAEIVGKAREMADDISLPVNGKAMKRLVYKRAAKRSNSLALSDREEEVLDFIKRQIYEEVAKKIFEHPIEALKAFLKYKKKQAETQSTELADYTMEEYLEFIKGLIENGKKIDESLGKK